MKSVVAELQWLGKGYFWIIWILLTVGLSTATAVVLSRRPLSAPHSLTLIDSAENASKETKLVQILFLSSVFIFLSCYIAITLSWEDFNYYDNSMFDLYTLQGHNYPPPITTGTGRFFPLSHQEFNVIKVFTSTIFGYHLFSIGELILFSFILISIDRELPIFFRMVLAIIVLLSSGVLLSFSQLIFAERNIVLVFFLLVVLLTSFERTKSPIWAFFSIIFVQLMLYYKETSFVMISCLGFGRIVLRLWIARFDKKSWASALHDKSSLLDLSIIMCGVSYLIYYQIMRIGMGVSYAAARGGQYRDVLLAYVSTDFLAVSLTLAVLGRTCLIISRRATPWVLWDSVAVGAVASAAAYIYLGLYSSYYLTLVDVIAVLYVGRLVALSWKNIQLWMKIGVVSLAILIVTHDIAFSLYSLYEEKNIVHIKTKIGDVIAQRYFNSHGPLRIFFPFSNPYVISEFAAYLDYRHMPVERIGDDEEQTAGAHRLIMVTPRTSSANDSARYTSINPDGRCVPWLPLRCRWDKNPAPGDVVVILPDDQVSAKKLGEGGPAPDQLVFEPWPRLSDRAIRVFLGPEAAVRFEQGRVPDHWLTGAVTERH